MNAFEVANRMAEIDIKTASDRAKFVARIMGAGPWDDAFDCEWATSEICDQFGVTGDVAKQAKALYANSLFFAARAAV